MKKFLIPGLLLFFLACNQQSNDAEMYEASELSLAMRHMVKFSEQSRQILRDSGHIDSIPQEFFDLASLQATRNEQNDDAFKTMAKVYAAQLKGIQRGDSQAYFYDQSIKACKSCHSTYCSGPLAIISKLGRDYSE